MTLVLIGPPAAGKSRVGRRVSRLLGRPFRDTDSMIAAEHGPIGEIFAERGEPTFRRWEADAVAAALTDGGVVSVGGGAVTHPATQHALAEHRVVLLLVSEEAVTERLSRGASRPLTANLETWRRLVAERMPLYTQLADCTMDTSRTPMTTVADAIAEWVVSEERKAGEGSE